MTTTDPSLSFDLYNSCSLGGICGGCFHYAKKYSEQLKLKRDRVKNLLDNAVSGPYEFEGIFDSPLIFGYRNKMEYSFGDCKKGGPLTLGLHRKRSFYDVIDAGCCRIVHNDFNIIVNAAAEYFRAAGVTYKDKKSHKGYLRYLILRRSVSMGEMLIDLVTTSQKPVKVSCHADINSPGLYAADGVLNSYGGAELLDEDKLISGFTELMLKASGSDEFKGVIKGILHTIDDAMSDAVKNDGTVILYGEDHITEKLLGLSFSISPFSFFQTNTLGAELLYSRVREYIADDLDKSMSIYDLYSGTGTIAQMLAPCVRKVTGVEIVEEAVEAARANAGKNGLNNCEFIADDVFRALDSLPRPDAVILDPPRDGVNPKALKKIIAYGVPAMVYVSCKPESLARDLITLQASGYRLIKAAAIDQFPWTDNVETVALISKEQYS